MILFTPAATILVALTELLIFVSSAIAIRRPRAARITVAILNVLTGAVLVPFAWWVNQGGPNIYGQQLYFATLIVVALQAGINVAVALGFRLRARAHRSQPCETSPFGGEAGPRSLLDTVPAPVRRSLWQRPWAREGAALLGMAAAALAVCLTFAWVLQSSFIYYPDGRHPDPAGRYLSGAVDVTLQTDDGLTLTAWLITPDEEPQGAVLFLPGNAGNRSDRVEVLRNVSERGFAVLFVEYRGLGGNTGTPTEAGLILDASAGALFLREQGFAQEHIYIVGESLGTGVATQLAARVQPAGLLLRSPYTALSDVADHTVGLPVGWLLRDKFRSVASIGDIECPVVVLAGSDDTLIPPQQSEDLARAVKNLREYRLVPGVGHNDSSWDSLVAEELVKLATG